MGKSKYVIGAIIDALGRVAVSSELVNIYVKTYSYSLTAERYLVNESPAAALVDQFKRQFGIDGEQLAALDLANSEKVCVGINDAATRELHMFVCPINSGLTFKIGNPSKNPVRFMKLGEIKWLVENKKLKLSWAGKQMLKFLDTRKSGILKGALL